MARTVEMQVGELRPRIKRIETKIKVLEKGEPNQVKSRKDNRRHQVVDVLAGDETGCVVLTLWDEDIEEVEEGKVYELTDGYTSVYKGNLRLNLSRYGKLKEVEGEDMEVDRENNVSEKTHEKYDRRRRRGGHRFGSGSFYSDY